MALISYKFGRNNIPDAQAMTGCSKLVFSAESRLKISGKARINVYENNKDSFTLLTWNLKYPG